MPRVVRKRTRVTVESSSDENHEGTIEQQQEEEQVVSEDKTTTTTTTRRSRRTSVLARQRIATQQKSTVDDKNSDESDSDEEEEEQRAPKRRRVTTRRSKSRVLAAGRDNSDNDDNAEEEAEETEKKASSSKKKVWVRKTRDEKPAKHKRKKNSSDNDDDDYVPDAARDDADEDVDDGAYEEELDHGMPMDDSSDGEVVASLKKKKGKKISLTKSKNTKKKSSVSTPVKKTSSSKTSTSSAPAFDPVVYMYSSEKQGEVADEERHKLFVEKLLSESLLNAEQRAEAGDGGDDDEESDGAKKKTKKKASTKTKAKSSVVKHTPLEQQVLKLKKEYPGVLMFVEVGYKFYLFGEDALNASKTNGLIQFQKSNFQCVCLPTHRLSFHLRKMILAGFKCGVVKQTETAALKAMDDEKGKKSAQPFTRDLTSMYSASTQIGEDLGDLDEGIFSHLLVINEESFEDEDDSSQKVMISMVCVDVTTGQVIYEEPFVDHAMRQELDTRLCKIQPIEVLLSEDVSRETERIVQQSLCRNNSHPRIEKYSHDLDEENQRFLTKYFEEFFVSEEEDEEDGVPKVVKSSEEEQLEKIMSLPFSVQLCFYRLIIYLKDFKLDHLLRLPRMKYHSFNTIGTMSLNGITLHNLEILQNSTDNGQNGSLYYIMDRTRTKFGARLLKQWITHPLTDMNRIQERLNAIDEIHNHSACLDKMIEIMKSLPDLEKTLMKIFYNKISPQEFLRALGAFQRIFENIPEKSLWQAELVKDGLLYQIFENIPNDLVSFIQAYLDSFSHQAAKEGIKSALFIKQSISNDTNLVTGSICGHIASYYNLIKEAKKNLDRELEGARKLFKKPSLSFKTYKNFKYVIELPIGASKDAPKEWIKLGQTKTLVRYHTQPIIDQIKIIDLNEDKLGIESDKAWVDLLKQFSSKYSSLKKCIDQFAILDCLNSLAELSIGQGYVKPEFVPDDQPRVLEIINGRHPVMETILTEREFVPNSTKMDADTRIYVCTGLNMGGKSSYLRQVSLIVLMAQIGCYVPAESCRLSIFDSIYTRMGASDNIARGQSTFFVELAEASEMLHHATYKSLVVLDEIGRGTSTYDGYSIAHAILTKLIEMRCFTLFVTHYPLITQLENTFSCVRNYHMSYAAPKVDNSDDSDYSILLGEKSIEFLYKLLPGMAEKSYGINVAKLAGIPPPILEIAYAKSKQIEDRTRQRVTERSFCKFLELLGGEATLDKATTKHCQVSVQQLSPLFL